MINLEELLEKMTTKEEAQRIWGLCYEEIYKILYYRPEEKEKIKYLEEVQDYAKSFIKTF